MKLKQNRIFIKRFSGYYETPSIYVHYEVFRVPPYYNGNEFKYNGIKLEFRTYTKLTKELLPPKYPPKYFPIVEEILKQLAIQQKTKKTIYNPPKNVRLWGDIWQWFLENELKYEVIKERF